MKKIKLLFKMTVILVLGGIIGFALICLSYIIPTDRIINHLSDATVYIQETDQYEYAPGYKGAILDNTTDAMMLGETAYRTGNLIYDASMVSRIEFTDSTPVFSLLGVVNGDEERDSFAVSYPRYWHGYLVLLKPFLYLFDFSDMRMFNLAATFLCAVFLILLMFNSKIYKRYVPAIITVFIFWNIASIGMCIQYSACFYISTLATIFVVFKKEKLVGDYLYLFFLIVGMLTAYFDFLTYPITTLGLPLIAYLIYKKADVSTKNCKELLKELVTVMGTSISWSAGYLLFWSEKWILGSLFTGNNVLHDAAQNLALRTSSVSDENEVVGLSRFDIVTYLIRVSFFKWLYIVLFAVVLIYIIFILYRRYRIEKKINIFITLINRVSLFVLGLYPIAWFFIAANHSYVHPRLVYRDLGVLIFAWMTMLLLQPTKQSGSELYQK